MAILNIKRQTGVALITVMLVVAIAVVLATKLSTALMFQIQRTDNLNSNQQAYWYAMGAEAFAKSVLTLSFKEKDDKAVTNLGQPWASGETSFPVDLGTISGEITDMHACFNLNSLINKNQNNDTGDTPPGENPDADEPPDEDDKTENNKPPGKTGSSGRVIENKAKVAFIELVNLLNIDGIGSFEAESMAEALIDWLDEDSSIASAGGAEDNDYAAKEYPYLAANSLLASVNELRLIEHFTPQVIFALQDFVCVIPNSDVHKININTIDEENIELLQALLGGIGASEAEEILSERGEEGFKNISEFTSLPAAKSLKDFGQFKQQFVVDSEYFKLTTKTSFNDSYFSMNSIMKINKDETISVVNRSVGVN
ncbi:type II secretion system minor pseudopilin GspK [Thalassotalea psychrophila]|uniref:Type II secretion system protein K n=1 Tax=Thalassotalea psychrophila TaxID=3065647 RepID=A0ABY9TV34_9GAMM|nr:type II secretion system minor pseudopilin GspK [Colwelliaceae bacterium SQ149]